MTTESAPVAVSACEPLTTSPGPITPADRSEAAWSALACAAAQLRDLAADIEARPLLGGPDVQLPTELRGGQVGALQLHAVARWLSARASLYGGHDGRPVVAVDVWDDEP